MAFPGQVCNRWIDLGAPGSWSENAVSWNASSVMLMKYARGFQDLLNTKLCQRQYLVEILTTCWELCLLVVCCWVCWTCLVGPPAWRTLQRPYSNGHHEVFRRRGCVRLQRLDFKVLKREYGALIDSMPSRLGRHLCSEVYSFHPLSSWSILFGIGSVFFWKYDRILRRGKCLVGSQA